MTEEINKKDSNFIPESTSGSVMEKSGNKESSDEYQRLINRGEEFTEEELIQRLEELGVKPDDGLDQKRLVRLWAGKKFKEPKKIDWLRGKLQEFKQAREGLVTAEVNRKKFEGIKRVLNLGQGTKAGAEKEYENAKQEYDLKRAEYIGEHVGRKLKEQTKLADLRVEEFDKKKGWGRKFYEGYKKLGEWNVGKLLGEKVMGKLETDEGDSGIMRFAKGTGRFFTKSLSVRTALSFSMLGAGIYLGAAGAGGAALTAIAGRRVLSGIGAGFGSYDLMKMFGERKERKEGMRKELTKEEVKDLSLEEIMDRMDHFEIGAELNNQKVSENETYKLFKQEFYVRARGGQIKQKIDELIKSTDQGITKIRVQEKTKERKRKIIASSIGTFIGSGGLAKVIDMGTDQLQDLYAGSEVAKTVGEFKQGFFGFLGVEEVEGITSQKGFNNLQEALKQAGPTQEKTKALQFLAQFKNENPEKFKELMENYSETQAAKVVPEVQPEAGEPMEAEAGGKVEPVTGVEEVEEITSQEEFNNLQDALKQAGPTLEKAKAMQVFTQLKIEDPEKFKELMENYSETQAAEAVPEIEPEVKESVAEADKVEVVKKGSLGALVIEQGEMTPEEMVKIKPEQIELATIGKGEGIEHSLIRQLEDDPTKFGYQGNLEDAKAVHQWAGSEAHQIAIDQGYVEVEGGGIVQETRVGEADKVAYVLEQKDGQNIVSEVDLTGKEIGQPETTEAHEYIYKPEPAVEPEILAEKELGDLNSTEKGLLQQINNYEGNTDLVGVYAKDAQEKAAEFLTQAAEEHPEYLNKYPDFKIAVQDIYSDQLNNELHEGFGPFGGPDSQDLMASTSHLAQNYDLSNKESNLFAQWMAGEDEVLKKGDFSKMMTDDKQFDPAKFEQTVKQFKELSNSSDLPENAWEPRLVQIGDEKLMVNMRAVEGGYQIDASGEGIPETALIYPKEEIIKEWLLPVKEGVIAQEPLEGVVELKTGEVGQEDLIEDKQPTSPEAVEDRAKAMFGDLDKGIGALRTFENPDVPFEEKISGLKEVIKDGDRIKLGNYDLTRQGDNIYFYAGESGQGIELTPDNINDLPKAVQEAEQTLLEQAEAAAKAKESEALSTDQGKIIGEADEMFAESEQFSAALKTFEDPDVPFEEKISSLKEVMEDGDRIKLGNYDLTRQGDNIYFYVGESGQGIELTPEVIEKLNSNVEAAKEAIESIFNSDSEVLEKVDVPEEAKIMFEQSKELSQTLDTFNDSNASFEEKITALKQVINDGERIKLGNYDLARQGDDIYYMVDENQGIKLTSERVEELNKAIEGAKEAVFDDRSEAVIPSSSAFEQVETSSDSLTYLKSESVDDFKESIEKWKNIPEGTREELLGTNETKGLLDKIETKDPDAQYVLKEVPSGKAQINVYNQDGKFLYSTYSKGALRG